MASHQHRSAATWKEFISAHMAVLAGVDFFTVEVLTWRGLATYYVLFFLQLETRRVSLAGITRHPTEEWMTQMGRNATDEACGCLRQHRYVLHDRDSIQQLVTQNHHKMKFFVGYAGWSPGQLESELEDGGWLMVAADNKHIFEDEEDLWPTLMREISDAMYASLNPKVIPEDPSMN